MSTTASPGFKLPKSSNKRYATHISRIIAAYSMGKMSEGSLISSFSFHTASERHVPISALYGSTQSPSLRDFTPAPTFTTVATPSDPATKGNFAREASVLASISAGLIGATRTLTSTSPHSSVGGIAADPNLIAFAAVTLAWYARIFGSTTSSYEPLFTPNRSIMSSTPIVLFESGPRARSHASNPAVCDPFSFSVFTSASARDSLRASSSFILSRNTPPPNSSSNSSSTVFSNVPVSSYEARFASSLSTSYARWILANVTASPPLSGCARVIKFRYARRTCVSTVVARRRQSSRVPIRSPSKRSDPSSFVVVASPRRRTSVFVASRATPSASYKSSLSPVRPSSRVIAFVAPRRRASRSAVFSSVFFPPRNGSH